MNTMDFKEANIGDPIYIKDYRRDDGVTWSGWGILMSLSTDQTKPYKVLAPIGNRPMIIMVDSFYLEKPSHEVRTAEFFDANGNKIEVSYGPYETDHGQEMIFGIESDRETFSFVIDDLSILIDALQEIK